MNRRALAGMRIRKMNRMIGVLMLVSLIGAEVVGFTRWLSPPEHDFANQIAVSEPATPVR